MNERAALQLAPTALIVGCGYLGRRLALRLMERGVEVLGTTRGPHTAAKLAELGVGPMMLSVTQPVTLAALRPALEAPLLDVYYMVPPGRSGQSPSPRQVILGGIAHMVKALRRANVRRAVLVSSTAVYGQTGGQRVDADTPPEVESGSDFDPDPDLRSKTRSGPAYQRRSGPASGNSDDRGGLLLQGEQLWMEAGEARHVVRLAGMYGPGRIIGIKAVREGAPLLGDPQALLNLIHVDDAAALLEAVMTSGEVGRVELGCDGSPCARIDYYTYLAHKLGVPAPQTMDARTAGLLLGVNAQRLGRASSKACDNIPTCRRTGWSPLFPNYRAGLDAVLAGRI